jgi:hypothetical protein
MYCAAFCAGLLLTEGKYVLNCEMEPEKGKPLRSVNPQYRMPAKKLTKENCHQK